MIWITVKNLQPRYLFLVLSWNGFRKWDLDNWTTGIHMNVLEWYAVLMMKWRSCPVTHEAPSLRRCTYQPGQRTFSDTETCRECLAKSPCLNGRQNVKDFFFSSKENKINCWRKKGKQDLVTQWELKLGRDITPFTNANLQCTRVVQRTKQWFQRWMHQGQSDRVFTWDEENIPTESFSTLILFSITMCHSEVKK